MVSPIAEAAPERFERPALKLLDRPDALLHDLRRFIERESGHHAQRHGLALLVAEGVQEGEHAAASEVLESGVLGGGGTTGIIIGVEFHIAWSDRAGPVVIDESRVGDGEGQGAHVIIPARNAIETPVKGEEDVVRDGLGVVDAVGSQVAEHPGRELLVGSSEALRRRVPAEASRLLSHHSDFFPDRCRDEPEPPVRPDCGPAMFRLAQST
jgi:hypothetical protein